MRNAIRVGLAIVLTGVSCLPATADIGTEEMFFADIPNVMTASKRAEKIEEAPGIISVITSDDIKRFGAVSLVDVLDRATGIYMFGSALYPTQVTSMRGDSALLHEDTHVLY